MTNYTINPAVDVSANRMGKVLLTNLVSKKKVELSSGAYQILLSMNNTYFSEQAFMDKFPDDQHNVGGVYFKFLKDNAVIISDNHFNKPQLSEYTYGLYNASTADIQVHNKCTILGLPFDKGNSESLGVSNAASALRGLCKQQNIDLKQADVKVLDAMYRLPEHTFDSLLNGIKNDNIVDVGDLYCPSFGLQHIYYEQMKDIAGCLLRNGNTPFFLGGDHSVTLPLLQAFSERFRIFGVLHIDAHTDMYEHALDIVFKETTTHHHGNFVCEAIKLPSIAAYHLIGIRGLNTIFPPQNDKLSIHYCNEVMESDAWMNDIDTSIPYYITFDIDVLDPAIAPATATPVPGGIGYRDIMHIMAKLCSRLNVIGADIVEYDTERDRQHITAQTALALMPIILNALCKKKK